MGTRGILGVRKDGKDKIAYNHFDSYPECLGQQTIEELHDLLKDRAAFEKQVTAWQEIDENKKPTPEQIEKCKPFTDLGVSRCSTDDWYCLLRKAQGSLKKMLAAGFYDDHAEFAGDSLMCEWGYVANLDENVLEFYQGFNHDKNAKGRYVNVKEAYKASSGDEYYGIALLGVISFDRISSDAEGAYADMQALIPKDKDEEEDAA